MGRSLDVSFIGMEMKHIVPNSQNRLPIKLSAHSSGLDSRIPLLALVVVGQRRDLRAGKQLGKDGTKNVDVVALLLALVWDE